jgi:ferredoxin
MLRSVDEREVGIKLVWCCTVSRDLPTESPVCGTDGPTWEANPQLAAAGFNASGILSARDYDALVPAAWRSDALLAEARSAVVLGCGGRAFADAFARSPEAQSLPLRDPIDRFSTRVVHEMIATMPDGGRSARALFYWERHENRYADFVALGRACGLGWDSRLAMLLHPAFGPWISIPAVVLTLDVLEPTPAQAGPAPCIGCHAPCASACPGGALEFERFDIDACSRTTLSLAPCRQRCDARRACVVGREHAYRAEAEQMFRSAVVRLLEDNPA